MTDNTPRVYFAGGWYFWHGDFKQRGIPSAAGFDYHAPTKRWRTTNPYRAKRLIEFADEATAAKINAEMETAAREVAAKGMAK